MNDYSKITALYSRLSVGDEDRDGEKPDTLEFAPFINIMSEWYARDKGMENRICQADRREENA